MMKVGINKVHSTNPAASPPKADMREEGTAGAVSKGPTWEDSHSAMTMEEQVAGGHRHLSCAELGSAFWPDGESMGLVVNTGGPQEARHCHEDKACTHPLLERPAHGGMDRTLQTGFSGVSMRLGAICGVQSGGESMAAVCEGFQGQRVSPTNEPGGSTRHSATSPPEAQSLLHFGQTSDSGVATADVSSAAPAGQCTAVDHEGLSVNSPLPAESDFSSQVVSSMGTVACPPSLGQSEWKTSQDSESSARVSATSTNRAQGTLGRRSVCWCTPQIEGNEACDIDLSGNTIVSETSQQGIHLVLPSGADRPEVRKLLGLLGIKDAVTATAAMHGSLFLLGPVHSSRLRCIMLRIAVSSVLESSILFCILASSILLAVDTPFVDPASKLAHFLAIMDIVFTCIFSTELVLRVMALGLVYHKGSYLRSAWNILDCIIVVTSLLSLFSSSDAFAIFKVIRLVRTLRPLRVIRRLKNMQLVVNTLIASVPSVLNVVLFGLFGFGMFAVLGVQLFSGQFNRCNDSAIRYPDGTEIPVVHRTDCTPGTFICEPGDLCESVGAEDTRTWATPLLNFNHIGNAMLSLFTISTLDNFMDIAYSCMDAVGVDMQPIRDHRQIMGMYVVIFAFLGGFFWVSLLVGVIIDQYTRMLEIAKKSGSTFLMSTSQVEWMQVHLTCTSLLKPSRAFHHTLLLLFVCCPLFCGTLLAKNRFVLFCFKDIVGFVPIFWSAVISAPSQGTWKQAAENFQPMPIDPGAQHQVLKEEMLCRFCACKHSLGIATPGQKYHGRQAYWATCTMSFPHTLLSWPSWSASL
jgi:hypothetical protein